MDTGTHEILILYGSQTGRAQYVAEEVSRELAKRDFATDVSALDEYDVTNLPNEKFVIFLVSTTGQGDPPDNMKNFWKFLLIKELPSDSLANVQFSVFGLGDSGYAKFNAAARRLYQRLLQLGAKEFHTRGLGDDQHEFGLDTEFVPWLEKLIEKLKEYFPQKNYNAVDDENAPVPKYLVNRLEVEGKETNNEGEKTEIRSLKSLKRNYCYSRDITFSKIVSNQKLTHNEAFKEVRYLELEAPKSSPFKYLPGDVAVILPRNDPEVCEKLAERLGYKYTDYVQIQLNPQQKSKKNLFPSEPIPVRELLEYWLNVMEPPTRFFFRILSHFTDDKLHKEKLKEFGGNTHDGKIEYNNYCTKEKRNVYEILFDFGTVNLPLNYLLEAVGLQKPREYSISTSTSIHPNRIGLTVAITEYLTPLKRQISGVCSSWFTKATVNEIVPLWIRRGTLPYPADPQIPVICVGPGTGIAPHLSFLEERVCNAENMSNTVVLFGNRNVGKDFIHKEMMEEWVSNKKMNLITAFSRDQEQKVYVYHKIKEHKKDLASLMLENKDTIRIFVCGSSKNMPKWVEETFLEILTEEIGLENAEVFIQRMQNEQRYVVEAW